MVRIETSEWPIVRITVDGLATVAAMEEYNAEMNKLLDFAEQQPEKYGIVYLNDMNDAEYKAHKREKAAQKLGNTWLKENRARIGERCVAIAMVMPNANTMMKIMRPIAQRSMKRMMGAPGDMFFTIDDAEAWMQAQLTNTA